MQVATGLFTADNTYLRAPVWLTPSDLGFRRANNYVILFLMFMIPTSNPRIISFTVKNQPLMEHQHIPEKKNGMSIDSTYWRDSRYSTCPNPQLQKNINLLLKH